MSLFREDKEFGPTMAAAGERLSIPPALVEKDYWLTQVLRGLRRELGNAFIFKGGTSLSKGFGMIQRFSEDIDVLIISDEAEIGREALLKRVEVIVHETALASPKVVSGLPGIRRAIRADYPRQSPERTIAYPYVRVDVGFAGGTKPFVVRDLTTLVGDALAATGQDLSQWPDLSAVSVPVLHPGRTFIEKLSLLHSRISESESQGKLTEARLWVRNYYDCGCLVSQEIVRELCGDREEYLAIVAHSEAVSRAEFPDRPTANRPEGGFGLSHAFAEGMPFETELDKEYRDMMERYYWGSRPYPTFSDVRAAVREVAKLL